MSWEDKIPQRQGVTLGVYSVLWEERLKQTQKLEVEPIPDYEPPYQLPSGSPRAFLDVRVGGHSVGRVVIELAASECPRAAENFLKLCEYKCYTGSMFKVFLAGVPQIVGGDFTEMDELVWNPENPECFDFPTLLPEPLQGGQSIYEGYFEDENFNLDHKAAGVVSMYNNGKPNTNGSQFMISLGPDKELDGKYMAFGQVVEGFDLCVAMLGLGVLDEYDGSTKQRITVESCGVLIDEVNSPDSSMVAPSALPARQCNGRLQSFGNHLSSSSARRMKLVPVRTPAPRSQTKVGLANCALRGNMTQINSRPHRSLDKWLNKQSYVRVACV